MPETFSLERSYILFCNMGLRHLVIVDEHNRVKVSLIEKRAGSYHFDEPVCMLGMRATHLAGTTNE